MRLFFETPQTHFWTHAFYIQELMRLSIHFYAVFFFKLHVIGCL